MNNINEAIPKDVANVYKDSGVFKKRRGGRGYSRTLPKDYNNAVYHEATLQEVREIYERENAAGNTGDLDNVLVIINDNGKDHLVRVRAFNSYGSREPQFRLEVRDDANAYTTRAGVTHRDTAQMTLSHLFKIAKKVYVEEAAYLEIKSADDLDPESSLSTDKISSRGPARIHSHDRTPNKKSYLGASDFNSVRDVDSAIEKAKSNIEQIKAYMARDDYDPQVKPYLIHGEYRNAEYALDAYTKELESLNIIKKDLKATTRYANSYNFLAKNFNDVYQSVRNRQDTAKNLISDLQKINYLIDTQDIRGGALSSSKEEQIKDNLKAKVKEYEDQVRRLQNKLEQAKLELEELEAEDPERDMWDINEPILAFQKELDNEVNHSELSVKDFARKVKQMFRRGTNVDNKLADRIAAANQND